ncbi:Homocysteine S-methyltransferase [Hyaloraphidium curvatum]|nr:Homocysteine S-methyltransferase [Hyaloraphidium curvatum]
MAVTILDGGVGHCLKLRGLRSKVAPETDGWFMAGALGNLERRDAVVAVHRDFIHAGCDVITTNSYVLTPWNSAKFSLDAKAGALFPTAPSDVLDALLEAACENARTAIAESRVGRHVAVAGCLPPLRESYQSTDLPATAELRSTYERIARVLQPRVDMYVAETMATSSEALAAVGAASGYGKLVFCSWTLRDDCTARLRDGTPLSSAVASLSEAKLDVDAVLVNCCSPAAVDAALPVLEASKAAHWRIGGYANGFRTTTSEWLGEEVQPTDDLPAGTTAEYDGTDLITVDSYAQWAERWASCGASVVGGCCGVQPQHMAEVVKRLKDR